jgi:TonB C terminal
MAMLFVWRIGMAGLVAVLGLFSVTSWAVPAKPVTRAKPAASSPASTCDAQLNRYVNQCTALIEKQWEARPREHFTNKSVSAKLQFLIVRPGKMVDPKLVKSSGLAWYDQEIMRVVRSTPPFAKPPDCMGTGVVVSLTFITEISAPHLLKPEPATTPEGDAPTVPAQPSPPMAGPPSPLNSEGSKVKGPPPPHLSQKHSPVTQTASLPVASSTAPSTVTPVEPSAQSPSQPLPDRKALAQRTFDAVNIGSGIGWTPAQEQPKVESEATSNLSDLDKKACSEAFAAYAEAVCSQYLKHLKTSAYSPELSNELSFRINRKGYLEAVTIIRSSGDVLFDKESSRAAWAAAPYSPLPSAPCSFHKSVDVHIMTESRRIGPKPLLNQLIDRHKRPMTY